MKTWRLYHKDGTPVQNKEGNDIVITSLAYSGEWMGDEFVTATIKSATPIDFLLDDYLVYRGEEYHLNVIPTVAKGARSRTTTEAFVYDNVKFYSYTDELTRCNFLDYVLGDNGGYYTGLPNFNFFAMSVCALADRLKANLDRVYTVNKWTVRVATTSIVGGKRKYYIPDGETPANHSIIEGNKNKTVAIDNKSCWEALALCDSEFDLSFIVRGREITIGETGGLLQKYFEYGKDKGLFKLERTTDDTQQVITRLRAFGNTTNIPTRYYANIKRQYYAQYSGSTDPQDTTDKNQYYISDLQAKISNHISDISDIKDIVPGQGWYIYIDGLYKSNIYAMKGMAAAKVTVRIGNTNKTFVFAGADGGVVMFFDWNNGTADYDAVLAGAMMYFDNGINKATWPSKWTIIDTSNKFPNNLNCQRLMLPKFPMEALNALEKVDGFTGSYSPVVTDPYIDSPNATALGIREHTVFFDGSDDLEDIYPSIEWVKDDSGNPLNVVAVGSTITDNGVFEEGKNIPNFEITIKDIGFDINDYLSSENATISFKDGMCGGREFTITKCEKVTEGYKLTLQRELDNALDLYFPYDAYQIRKDDKFVLLNINMPDTYVEAAAKELLKQAQIWLSKNDYVVYKYSLSVDEIFMQRQHDERVEGEDSIYETIKAGSVLRFKDDDLAIEASITIDKLEIKETDGKLPEYSITLVEEKSVGTIQRMQQKIDSIANGGGGGYSASDIETILKNKGKEYFLSKQSDDTAKGTITFEQAINLIKGLMMPGFVTGVSGGAFLKGADGDAHLEADFLTIHKKAIFNILEVVKTQSVAGKWFITPAGSIKVTKAETATFVNEDGEEEECYRCYFNSDDGEQHIENLFRVDDFAFSQDFNIKAGVYQNVSNRYYWRRVIGVGDDYIDLSITDRDLNSDDVPQVDDVICQVGNLTDKTRQNAIVLSSVDSLSPSITLFEGIDTYSFSGKEMIDMGVTVDKEGNPKSFFKVYGDLYAGARDESTYVKYDREKGKVTIKGNLEIGTTFNNQTLEEYVKENGGLKEEKIQELIDATAKDLQNQIDGAIETWYLNGEPTLANEPAIGWTTDEDKKKHIGDLYYDKQTGYAYRFLFDNDDNAYKWVRITDTDITTALANAAKAQSTADGKMTVFSAQPTPPYQVGDIWVNATYPNGNTEKNASSNKYYNDILRCTTTRKEGNFSITEWMLASDYGELLDNFVNSIYNVDKEAFQSQIDGKIETWFTDTDPSGSWNDTEKAKHKGDIWYKSDKTAYHYDLVGGTYTWVKIEDSDALQALQDASNAQDTADGKRRIFTSQPTDADEYDVGDLWVNATYGTIYKNDILRCNTHKDARVAFNISHWTLASKYTDDSALTEFINGTYAQNLSALQTQVDKKAETWYQASDPSLGWTDAEKAEHEGDIWYNSSDEEISGVKAGQSAIYTEKDGNYLWVVDNTVPQSVFDKIDGKASIYVSKPDSYKERDLWILESEYTLNGKTYPKGTIVVALQDSDTWNADHWEKKDRYTDDSALDAFKTEISYLSTYLKARQETTTIEGGLVLTSLISLGRNNALGQQTVWSGISGWYDTTKQGLSIAAWYGGEMIDKETTEGQSASRPAQSLFRMDGSGYLAGGKISWDSLGNGRIGKSDSDFVIKWDVNGFSLGDGIKIGSSSETLSTLLTYITKFDDLFKKVSIGTNSNGQTIYAIQANYGFYSNDFVSAFGVGSGGSSGGGGISYDRLDAWTEYSSSKADWVLSAALGNDLNTRLSAIEKGSITPDLSGYATQSWVEGKGYLTASDLATYATQQWVENKGYATQSVIDELHSEIESVSTRDSFLEITAEHISASTLAADYITANDISSDTLSASNLTATTIEGNLAWSYITSKPSVVAGNGLTGGGELSESRTINVASANDAISVNADNILLNTIDNLTTASATKPLSAAKGKALNDRLALIEKMFEWDGDKIKAKAGFYSVDFVSAFGVGSGGSSGGGSLDVTAMWAELGTTVTAKVIDISHIPTIPTSKISGLSTYATQSWVENKNYATQGTIAELHSEIEAAATRNEFLEVLAEYISTNALAVGYLTANTIEGNLAWSYITDKPSWVGTNKPTYTTKEIAEDTNLYYTDARVAAKVTKSYVDGLGINASYLGGTAKGDLLTSVGLSASQMSVTVGGTTKTASVPTWNQSTTGNAATATAFASAKSISLTGDVTGSASSTGGWSIATTIGSGKVTNAMLAGSIANSKLANSSMTIAGTSVSLGGSISAATIGNALTTSAPAAYATNAGQLGGTTKDNLLTSVTASGGSIGVTVGGTTKSATASGTWGISISGTAAKATADADGNTISTTYLKRAGGTMTGGINLAFDTANTFRLYSSTSGQYSTGWYYSTNGMEAMNFIANNASTSFNFFCGTTTKLSNWGASTHTSETPTMQIFRKNVRINRDYTSSVVSPALEVGGTIVATGNITAYTSASDMRLKNVTTLDYDALFEIMQLSTFKYKWNDTARRVGLTDEHIHYGLSAQECQILSSTLISTEKVEGEYLILNKAEFVPLLVQAVKQLNQKVIELENLLAERV